MLTIRIKEADMIEQRYEQVVGELVEQETLNKGYENEITSLQ